MTLRKQDVAFVSCQCIHNEASNQFVFVDWGGRYGIMVA